MRPILPVFVAAASATAQLPAPTVRDSAGVRIVEHQTIKTTNVAFRIGTAVVVDLGGLKDDPNAELDPGDPFPNAVRLEDGRYVASTRTALKFFDRTGRYIRTVGRAGDGPGEFRQNREVCRAPGDTLVVLPYSGRQVSVFDSSGEHVRSFTVAGGFLGGACFDDGSLVLSTNYRVNPETRMPAPQASQLDRIQDLVRVRSNGSQVGVIASSHLGVYFAPETRPNAYARGRLLHTGDGRTAEFRVYSIDGKLTQIVRWRDALIKATGAERSGEAERGAAGVPQQEPRGLGIVPAYADILVDEAGRIWVEDYLVPRARGNWTVFAADGNVLGRVTTPVIPGADPRRTEIVRMMRDQVLVSWRATDTGALHLSVHTLASAR